MLTRRVSLFTALLLSVCLFASTHAPVRAPRPRAITQCSWNGNTFSLLDAPAISSVATFGDLHITGRFISLTEDKGAVLTFLRGDQSIFEKQLPELVNPNGWLGYSDDVRSIAINSSDGGAAGGWSVALLRVDNTGAIQDLSSVMQKVEKHFSSRHSCKTRGDNFEAMQWRSNTELLISASVYGTSDCGKDMGYTEGYILDVQSSRIVHHLSEREMLSLPYVCTYNVWKPGDPNPK